MFRLIKNWLYNLTVIIFIQTALKQFRSFFQGIYATSWASLLELKLPIPLYVEYIQLLSSVEFSVQASCTS